MATTGSVAREYQRVSFDRSGRERSPEEQRADNQRAANRHGWTLGAPYRDIGSASRYARKAREDFARLMADLESGRFGADVLILWESSRGSRKVSEWCALIEACQAANVQIYVTSSSHLYDCANPRDRKSLQEDAVDSEYEAGKTSIRVTRSSTASAADGRPGPGRPAYGFRRVYDPTTGRVEQQIDPEEAEVVRELYRRLHAGHSLHGLVEDFAARGIRRRNGTPFDRGSLRTIALNRANIGERVHDPAPGRRHGKPSAVASITPASWPAIVDRPLWIAVYRRLTDPARTTTRPGRGVHWLTWLTPAVVCDVCDGQLQARTWSDTAGEPRLHYYCHRATHVRVPYEALNNYVEAALLAYLARDDIAKALTAEPVDADAVAAAEEEVATIEQEIESLAEQLGAGGPAAQKLLAISLPKIETRLAAAKARRDDLTAPSLLRGLIRPGRDVRRRWKVAPMSARRDIARIVLVPELLGQVRITRALSAGQSIPVQERAAWRTS